jgi:hypothetical protein
VSSFFANLSGAQIRKGLHILKNRYASEDLEVAETYDIIINVKGIDKANVKIIRVMELLQEKKSAGSSFSMSRVKGGIKIRAGINVKELKAIINAVEDALGKSGRKMSEDAESTSVLMEKLSEYSSFIYLSDGEGGASDQTIKDKLHISQKFLGYPWNFSTKDVNLATKEGNEVMRKKLI